MRILPITALAPGLTLAACDTYSGIGGTLLQAAAQAASAPSVRPASGRPLVTTRTSKAQVGAGAPDGAGTAPVRLRSGQKQA